MFSQSQIEQFINSKNYDIRISGNARWIDQKCTPDVLWSISDFILNYVNNCNEQFTVKDIWSSDYAKLTIAETYSKPGTDEKNAENEYDKVFSQPINLLCYAGILEDISPTSRHLYRIINRDVLEYIARNDIYSLRFLQSYIEKVLRDSELYHYFQSFFDYQDSVHYVQLKDAFIQFYHDYTPVRKDYEPKRIFTKVINPLAYKYSKKGSERGRMSKDIITRSDMMYNQDNFRDVYAGKPKNVTRKEWLESHPHIDIRRGYFEQMMNKAKRIIKDSMNIFRNNISELTQFSENHTDNNPATQLHHIFPKNEFPEIMHYLENIVAITPNQHFGFAHPNNNTSIIDLGAQKELLLVKVESIQLNLSDNSEDKIYEFENLLYVLCIGLEDSNMLNIKHGNYDEVVQAINTHY